MEFVKTHAAYYSAADLCASVNQLVKINLSAGTLPYANETPMPQDMNVINGRHLGDLNKVQLELKAAKIGASSLKWIYGADAVFLGLELKDASPVEMKQARDNNKNFDITPIVAYANTQRALSPKVLKIAHQSNIAAEGLGVDAQCVYLLDQFTNKSIQRAMRSQYVEEQINLRGSDAAKKQSKAIAKNFITNMSEYDTGLREQELRSNMRQNMCANFSAKKSNGEQNPVFHEVLKTRQTIFGKYSDSQKFLFNVLNSYYAKQATGITLNKKPEDREAFKATVEAAFSDLVKKDDPTLTRTLSDTVLYTDRSSHLDFSYDVVYTQKDTAERLSVLAPKAAKFLEQEEVPDRIISDKERERLRGRTHEYKSPEIRRGR